MHYDPSQENEPKETFVEFQDSMVKDLKAIARLSQDMVTNIQLLIAINDVFDLI